MIVILIVAVKMMIIKTISQSQQDHQKQENNGEDKFKSL